MDLQDFRTLDYSHWITNSVYRNKLSTSRNIVPVLSDTFELFLQGRMLRYQATGSKTLFLFSFYFRCSIFNLSLFLLKQDYLMFPQFIVHSWHLPTLDSHFYTSPHAARFQSNLLAASLDSALELLTSNL